MDVRHITWLHGSRTGGLVAQLNSRETAKQDNTISASMELLHRNDEERAFTLNAKYLDVQLGAES